MFLLKANTKFVAGLWTTQYHENHRFEDRKQKSKLCETPAFDIRAMRCGLNKLSSLNVLWVRRGSNINRRRFNVMDDHKR